MDTNVQMRIWQHDHLRKQSKTISSLFWPTISIVIRCDQIYSIKHTILTNPESGSYPHKQSLYQNVHLSWYVVVVICIACCQKMYNMYQTEYQYYFLPRSLHTFSSMKVSQWEEFPNEFKADLLVFCKHSVGCLLQQGLPIYFCWIAKSNGNSLYLFCVSLLNIQLSCFEEPEGHNGEVKCKSFGLHSWNQQLHEQVNEPLHDSHLRLKH